MSDTTQPDVVAFIGKGVTFKGSIRYRGTFRIDGMVEGDVEADGTLIIGDQAELRGKISAGTVISQGKVYADVVAAESVKLQRPAVLDGTIRTPKFSMEEGVLFTGRCAMASESTSDDGPESRPRLLKT
ncbi:bactofilin family protein [Candidatus Nitrospira bockiana]